MSFLCFDFDNCPNTSNYASTFNAVRGITIPEHGGRVRMSWLFRWKSIPYLLIPNFVTQISIVSDEQNGQAMQLF
ncbi:MAG: hypothetical protein CML56_07035 [Rhodobacteraceae bacterium]|nr:hypothetical protein [Paracoccaceae bacterium]